MSLFDGKFESKKQEWVTPQDLFDKVNEEFHFTFDLAADETNAKCKKFFSEQDDALSKNWEDLGNCWLNPPYGNKKYKLENWIKKAYCEAIRDTTVVMLIPARTNTRWWHFWCMRAKEIKLLCGRPKFVGCKHGLPWPLALVVFGHSDEDVKFSSFYVK